MWKNIYCTCAFVGFITWCILLLDDHSASEILCADVSFFFWVILRRLKCYVPTFRSSFGWFPDVWIFYTDVSFFFWVIPRRLNFLYRRFILLLGDSPASEMLCADVSFFFWVIPRRLNFLYRRFILLLGDSPASEMLCADVSFFFWEIPRRLNSIYRRFVLLFGESPASEMLFADVSKQSVYYFFKGVVSRKFKHSFQGRTRNGVIFRSLCLRQPPPPTCPCSFPDRVIPHPSFGQQTPHKLWKILHNGHGAIVRETRIFNDTLLTGWNYAK